MFPPYNPHSSLAIDDIRKRGLAALIQPCSRCDCSPRRPETIVQPHVILSIHSSSLLSPSSRFAASGNHGIIASKRCNHVRMVDNHVCDGLNAGLFLHRSSDQAIVTGNHVHNNGDAGLAVLESFYMDVSNNVFNNNRYGIRFSVGSGYNWVSVEATLARATVGTWHPMVYRSAGVL